MKRSSAPRRGSDDAQGDRCSRSMASVGGEAGLARQDQGRSASSMSLRPSERCAMNATETGFGECPCPLCETSTSSDAGYFARAFGEPRLFAATGEAMADALGFCPRHGASLLSQEQLSDGVVQVLRNAIPRVMLLLNEDYLREPQVQQALFAAGSACPACTYASRAVGRHAASLARQFSGAANQAGFGRLDALCVGHFQRFAADLAPTPRLAVLIAYADNLDRVAGTMKVLLRTAPETDAWPPDDTAATLNHPLGLVAGMPAAGAPSSDAGFAGVLEHCPTLVDAISLRQACPICIETARARQRWLQNVQAAAHFEQDAWLFFPTCSEHIGMVARLGEPKLTAAVVSRALSVTRRYLRQQIQVLVRAAELRDEQARIKAEGPEVWAAHKRKRAKQNTVDEKVPTARLAPCPGCARIEIAEIGTAGKLVDLLHQKKYRDAFGRCDGLCMRHFAQTYLLAPKGLVRSMLAEDQRNRLAEFARSLDEGEHGTHEHETGDCLHAPWRVGLGRFCGFS